MSGALHGPEFMDLDDFEELVLDRPDDQKWELINGRVVRGMIGARLSHHRVIQNVNFALRPHIRARGLLCQSFTETFWLKQRFQKLAALPDIMVHLGPMEPHSESIDDPLVLIEVVSPGSRDRDRGEKAAAYMRLVSARHICLVDRDRIRIDVFDRRDAAWLPREPVESLSGVFELAALEFSMPVSEVYRDVLPAAAS
jgi:Uma2 family endonuclease